MYYKKVLSIIFILAMAVFFGLIMPEKATSKILTNVEQDVSGEELKAVVIEDFEEAKVGENGWTAVTIPKKFEKAETEEKLKMKDPVPILDLRLIDGKPGDLSVEEWSLTGLGKKKEKCLGVHFQFRYAGENSVHILAPPEVQWKDKVPAYTYNPSTRKDEQERGLQLPGRAKGISLWVHGRGHPYSLEVWVKDYQGSTHILKFGTINFVGWRPVKVYLPSNIPQTYESYPQTRVTKITRFVIRNISTSDAEELITDSFFFFDQIKVLTDTYEVNFDGSELHKAFGGKTESKSGEKK